MRISIILTLVISLYSCEKERPDLIIDVTMPFERGSITLYKNNEILHSNKELFTKTFKMEWYEIREGTNYKVIIMRPDIVKYDTGYVFVDWNVRLSSGTNKYIKTDKIYFDTLRQEFISEWLFK